MFTIHSLNVNCMSRYIFIICSLYIHYMLTICSQYVHYMAKNLVAKIYHKRLTGQFTRYQIQLVFPKEYAHYTFTISSLYIYNMFSIYSLYDHYMFTIYSSYVYYIFKKCSPYVDNMFTICSLYVHYKSWLQKCSINDPLVNLRGINFN